MRLPTVGLTLVRQRQGAQRDCESSARTATTLLSAPIRWWSFLDERCADWRRRHRDVSDPDLAGLGGMRRDQVGFNGQEILTGRTLLSGPINTLFRAG